VIQGPRAPAVIPALVGRFLVPSLSALIMLIVLIGLGTWQIYRLHWKQGILAQIAAAESAPPIPLGPDPAPYTKVSATGRFRFDRAALFGAEVRDTQAGPTMGSYQIVPLERAGDPPILVNRGWIPQKREAPLDDPAGDVTVTGYIRPGDTPHWFSAADDSADRQFFTLDPGVIGGAVGEPDVLPYALVVLGPETPRAYPAPAQHLPQPPNNHLSYVITWYGLALSLVVVFVVWMRKALRQ
jgi:surfeit locus 1 family protein